MPSPRTMLAALLLALLLTGPAAAHRLKLFASIVGGVAEGRVYFVGGGAAQDVPVTLLDAGGNILATTRSSTPEGRFALPIPPSGAALLRADAQDGHVAEFGLVAAAIADTAPASPPEQPLAGDEAQLAATIETAVARQLAPLAEQIDALESTLGFRDMIGGAGAVFGLFGIWALIRSRHRK